MEGGADVRFSLGPDTAAMTGERARALAKPPVRKFAKDNGVDLSAITPARADGVITRAEVEAHLLGAVGCSSVEWLDSADLAAAAADYKRAVHTGEFPADEHTF